MSDNQDSIMNATVVPDANATASITAVNGHGNHGDQGVRHYPDQRGSAAPVRSLVPVGADPGGSPGQGRQRKPKRDFGEAMSPKHATAVAQALPDAPSRMKALVLKGLDKDARDKIQQADDQLALTRAMRTIENNQEVMAEYIRGLYNACVVQDGRVEQA